MQYRIEGNEFVGERELPIIIIDFDDTLGPLAQHWVDEHNRQTGSSLKVEDLVTWDFPSIMGEHVYTSLERLDSYQHFTPFPNIVEKIKRLEKYAKILIATASRTGLGAAAKIEICRRMFPHYEVWKADSKHNIRAFALVDDNPGTAKSAKELGTITCAIRHPWHNQYVKDAYDLLADSYLSPGEAWDQIIDFLIRALKTANKPKIMGKRYNLGKPAYDLIPASVFSILVQKTKYRKRGRAELMRHLVQWRNTTPPLIKTSPPQDDREILVNIIGILTDNLWLAFTDEVAGTALWPGLFAADQVARVLTGGAIKYAPRNWEKGLSFVETWASGMRHIEAFLRNKATDDESKLSHWSHALCNFCFLLHFTENYERYAHLDDR